MVIFNSYVKLPEGSIPAPGTASRSNGACHPRPRPSHCGGWARCAQGPARRAWPSWRCLMFTLWWTNILQWKITIFNGKLHYKWPFSIAMLVHQRVTNDFQWFNDDNDGWFSTVITALLSYMDFDSTWFLVSFYSYYSCWITDAFLFFAWFSTRTRSIILKWLFGPTNPHVPVLVVRVSVACCTNPEWFLCQELVPRQRVGEVGNEHPSQAEANTSKEGHGEPWGFFGENLPQAWK